MKTPPNDSVPAHSRSPLPSSDRVDARSILEILPLLKNLRPDDAHRDDSYNTFEQNLVSFVVDNRARRPMAVAELLRDLNSSGVPVAVRDAQYMAKSHGHHLLDDEGARNLMVATFGKGWLAAARAELRSAAISAQDFRASQKRLRES